MSKLKTAFESNQFVITCELSPPKGTQLAGLIDKAEMLNPSVVAFNLTDSAAARMTMDPMVAGYELLQRGMEPIVQVTSRDKNRLALQSGMLGAHVLGIPNLVIMGGDPPHIGDHPEAKGVNDLFSSQIIEAANALNHGKDHAGNDLQGATDFYIGSVCNPGARDLDAEVENTQRKIDAGAQFFQTQAIYQVDQFKKFRARLDASNPMHGDRTPGLKKTGGLKVLAGIIPIKSVKMSTYMNERVPGIHIPDALIARIQAAEQRDAVVAESLAIAADTINELREWCDGIHIMAIGWEKHITALLQRADA